MAAIAAIVVLIVQFAPGHTLHRWFGPMQTAAAARHACTGPVLYVVDGDTVWMRCGGERIEVRLSGIDAPEVAHPKWGQAGQPGGARARFVLIGLVGGQSVTLEAGGEDDYGRTLGVLLQNGANINLVMIRKGWAWAYPGYATARYVEAQHAAQAARRGLWAFPPSEIEPPWEFRHRHSGY